MLCNCMDESCEAPLGWITHTLVRPPPWRVTNGYDPEQFARMQIQTGHCSALMQGIRGQIPDLRLMPVFRVIAWTSYVRHCTLSMVHTLCSGLVHVGQVSMEWNGD